MAGQIKLVNLLASMEFTRVIFLFLVYINSCKAQCTDDSGYYYRCRPDFINAAFEAHVTATNTCGVNGAEKYCRLTPQTYNTGGSCDDCHSTVDGSAHPAEHLVDADYDTWWQSQTMVEVGQTQDFNITINLGKSFEITYIRLQFHSIRPDSFAIYKRTSKDGPWIPYQYFSSSCSSIYGLPDSFYIPPEDETRAICTSDFSDISPLTNGNIAFSTLEGRPNAANFDTSHVLQEWVTATDILVTLTRMNTFGDEVSGADHVLRTYYYAISNLAVEGRCKCNGHARECTAYSEPIESGWLQCACEHNTMGPDCSQCLPGFNDRPWRRAAANKANECKPCQCNGKSAACYFDQELYDKTGHGSHCTECSGNTAGANCERCKDGFSRASAEEQCQPDEGQCTDVFGMSYYCQPDFINAAFEAPVTATNTCGVNGAEKYCRLTPQTYNTGGSCGDCDSTVDGLAHPAEHLVDADYDTWWQSQTMVEVEQTQDVNITISLGKSFQLTYIRLHFHSIRPESFAIYKRTTKEGPWIPYQYFSGSCSSTYGLSDSFYIPPEDETRAICTSDFSDISPLTNSAVAFSTLVGRPSALNFDNSAVLQEWVTASDILITLTKMNTFGDEVFGEEDVLRTYYYAISDFSVGGRCKCNGHARECTAYSEPAASGWLQCACEHNTVGPDCSQCLPGFNDRPWRRAAADKANECKPCQCNGKSSTCYFDQELYDKTGHGSHCTECSGNTAGANCERCKDGFSRASAEEQCQPDEDAPHQLPSDDVEYVTMVTEFVTVNDEPEYTTVASEIDECDSSLCLHDGRCVSDFNAGYTCECQQGWTGTHCQTSEKIVVASGKNTLQ